MSVISVSPSCDTDTPVENWQDACTLALLTDQGSKIIKIDGKQIALFLRHGEIYACNNRCPHEGYPLKEGNISGDCILTCNWHNWKFDLKSGENLYGGDRLRTYPVRIEDGTILLNVADLPKSVRAKQALNNLQASFERHEYDRMAREIVRFEKAGGDALDTVRHTIAWTHDKFEAGMASTHAHIAAADWLSLRQARAETPAARLMAVHEIIAYLAWDCQREPSYPYPQGSTAWVEDDFVQAIEAEDEAVAIAHVRGALEAGLTWHDMERGFARAALAHYLNFGHGAIYVIKTGELLEKLGDSVAEPLLLLLTRGLVMSRREDLIPEFREYTAIKQSWTEPGDKRVTSGDFEGLGPVPAMKLAAQAAQDPQELYHILFERSCRSLLRFDLAKQDATDIVVTQNCSWLDVSHEITFANAAHRLSVKYPELWHDTLLQMCCFFGRNAKFQDLAVSESDWQIERPDDPEVFLNGIKDSLFDHSQAEFIVSAHLIKMTYAVADEIALAPQAAWKNILLAGLNRFLNSPLKRRHSLRTAYQALSIVALED